MRRSPAFWLALLLVLLALVNLAAEAYLSSFGRPELSWPTRASVAQAMYDLRHGLTFLLILLLAPAALVVLVLAAVRARQRRRAPVQLLASAGVLVGGIALLFSLSHVTQAVRTAGFRQASERLDPLVLAVARYERERGRPPASLDQLAPTYVPEVSRFGVRGCRPLEYQTTGASGEWQLALECPNGWVTLDRFFYRPGERYAPHEYNQRFGDWAYFWD